MKSLAAGEPVSAATSFPGAVLAYEIVPGGTEIAASFSVNTIRIAVPHARLAVWAAGSDIGLNCDQAWDSGSLHISLEKDLACVSKRAEDDSDAFPNPAASAGSCH